MITDMLLFVPNTTSFKGAPGGGNNGCDGVWGAACSEEIRTKLPEAIARKAATSQTGTDRFLERAVAFVDFSEGSTACVRDMWSGAYGLGIGEALTLNDLTAGINQEFVYPFYFSLPTPFLFLIVVYSCFFEVPFPTYLSECPPQTQGSYPQAPSLKLVHGRDIQVPARLVPRCHLGGRYCAGAEYRLRGDYDGGG
jgi:hypothetical protein